MNSFEENKNPDVPKKLIQNGGSWISNEKTSAVNYELGDTYSYRYEDSIPDYASDTLEKLRRSESNSSILLCMGRRYGLMDLAMYQIPCK